MPNRTAVVVPHPASTALSRPQTQPQPQTPLLYALGDRLQRTIGNRAVGRLAAAHNAAQSQPPNTVHTPQPEAVRMRALEAIVQRGKTVKPHTHIGAGAARHSTRERTVSPPRFLEDAMFDPEAKRFAGSRTMLVIMGPAALGPGSGGQTPIAGDCIAAEILEANNYLGRDWKKGHLWSNEMGGPGDFRNLSPISGAANAEHERVMEGPVKSAMRRLYSLLETTRNSTYFFGIRYEVKIVGHHDPAGANAAIRAIGNELVCSARYVRRLKTGGPIEDVPVGDIGDLGMLALPGGVIRISTTR